MNTIKWCKDLSYCDRKILINVLIKGINAYADKHGWDNSDTKRIEKVVDEIIGLLQH